MKMLSITLFPWYCPSLEKKKIIIINVKEVEGFNDSLA